MKYFKLIEDENIIGVVTSDNFMRYLPVTDCFIRANEEIGEYVSYKGQFYRGTWMAPYTHRVEYKEILIIEITEEEYNIYAEAFLTNDVIAHETEPIEEEPEYIDPIQTLSIEFIRSSKINEMSYNCHTAIEAGFDLDIRGDTHHFSLTTQD